MLAVELLLLLMVGAALVPDSRLGRWLIDAPAKALARTTRAKVLFGLLAVLILIAFVVAAPEVVVFFGLADFSLIADATALMLLAGVAVRFAAVRTTVQRILRRGAVIIRRAPRRRRAARLARRPRPPRGDPEPGWSFA